MSRKPVSNANSSINTSTGSNTSTGTGIPITSQNNKNHDSQASIPLLSPQGNEQRRSIEEKLEVMYKAHIPTVAASIAKVAAISKVILLC